MKKMLYMPALFLLLVSISMSALCSGIVCFVNNSIITSLDISRRASIIKVEAKEYYNSQPRSAIDDRILDILIDEALLEQDANKHGIDITDKELTNALQTIAKSNNLASRSELDGFLEKVGISIDGLIKQITAQLLRMKYTEAVIAARVKVTATEIKENRLRMSQAAALSNRVNNKIRIAEIVVYLNSEEDVQSSMKEMQRLRDEILNGADFVSIAKSFSQSNTATNGGDLGWILIKQLHPDLLNLVLRMKVGDISEPILMKNAIRIIKLIEEEKAEEVELTDEQIGSMLFNDKLARRLNAKMRALRNAAYIKKNLP